ncbi:MAG: phytanoyl-CoA dioxygenase family protein, partial [Acidimicrobiaceae bacterium]|nr:phytanoyl-CoA dioxygenase family protein [Acidimicrobiaceae bacterium]
MQEASASMGRVLTEDQVDDYLRDGWLSPFDLLTADEVAAARLALEDFEASCGGDLGPVYRSGSHMLLPWVDDLIRHPRLLDAVEELIGPDLL